MILRLFTNCQGQGLEVFLKRAMPNWDIKCLPHLATFYQEFSDELLAEEYWKADLVLFHHKRDGELDFPTKQPKIPLSVWFQSAPFMAHVPNDLWAEFKSQGGTPEAAVHHDFDYQSRWDICVERMIEKEENEQVDPSIRISDISHEGRTRQLQLTCNHPTSYVFYLWTHRILELIDPNGSRGPNRININEALFCPNLAGLPCEESATSGARKALSLSWGGRPEDDESGLQIARERMALI